MTVPVAGNSAELKKSIREQAHANRNAQENKDELSRETVRTFMSLPEYQAAKTVLFYLDVRSEVRTRHSLEDALASGKKIVVPYCIEGEVLELFHLESMDELSIGMYRILNRSRNFAPSKRSRCRSRKSI